MVLEQLVEPDGHVHGGGAQLLVARLEIAEQRPGRDRDVFHSPFDEVAGGRRFGKHDQGRRHLERHRLRQHRGDAINVLGVFALGGAELGDGDAEHGGKIPGADRGGRGGVN